MRVLHLTTELPHPSGISGGSSRQYHLDARLVDLGHEVTVIAPVSEKQKAELRPAETLGAAGIRLVATPRRSTRGREALTAMLRQPALLPRSTTTPVYGIQTEMLALDMRSPTFGAFARRVDVVAIDHDFSVHLARLVPPDVPMVLTLHNDTPSYYRARAASATGLRRALLERQALLADRYISPYLDDFASLVAVSASDATLVRARTDRPVDVVPNGTETGGGIASARVRHSEATVLFSGTLSHPPNHEGILWFYDEVWPKVCEEVPDARLVVAGRNPQREVLNLASTDAAVEVTGEVASMRPYFADATVAVVPLLSGGGTRLKILDALSAMVPTVTTEIGREGLAVEDGVHLLVASDPDQFADRIVRLLTDPEFASELAGRGRQLVEGSYDWQILGKRYADLLARAQR